MHLLEHAGDDPDAHRADERPRLRVLGIVCGACGHEATEADARSEGWQGSEAGDRTLCGSCAALVALDDRVLFWAPCGHLDEHDAVVFDRPFCVICDS